MVSYNSGVGIGMKRKRKSLKNRYYSLLRQSQIPLGVINLVPLPTDAVVTAAVTEEGASEPISASGMLFATQENPYPYLEPAKKGDVFSVTETTILSEVVRHFNNYVPWGIGVRQFNTKCNEWKKLHPDADVKQRTKDMLLSKKKFLQ